LDEYPFSLKLKPPHKFSVGEKEITSTPDFEVTKDGVVVLLDEDKHVKNTSRSKAWGEHQMAGEMLACAFYNYDNMEHEYTEKPIYAMRVIGTRFTFYKSIFSASYLRSVGEGFPSTATPIKRYPLSNKFPSNVPPFLDFAHPLQRKEIVELLASMKTTLNEY